MAVFSGVGVEASMSKRKSYKQRSYWLDIKRGICPNCGEKGPHYVPPSLGDKGFFMCKRKDENE